MPHRDFTSEAEAMEEVTFTMGDDPYLYHGIPADEAPAGVLLDLGNMANNETGKTQRQAIGEFYDAILAGDDAIHFADRMTGKVKPGISIRLMLANIEWLMEVYVGRPPEQSAGSRAQRRANGRASTAGSRTAASKRGR